MQLEKGATFQRPLRTDGDIEALAGFRQHTMDDRSRRAEFDGGAQNDEIAILQDGRDLLRGLLDESQLDLAVLVERRADRDDVDARPEAWHRLARETEGAAAHDPLELVLQPGLEEVRFAAGQHVDHVLADFDPHDLEA